MHEITLCQQTFETIEQFALANHATQVTDVYLHVGAFSCIEPAAMDFCFELVCRDTIAENCQLHLQLQEAHCFCNHCQRPIELLSIKVHVCPFCASRDLTIDANDDVTIEKIAII